MTERGVFDSETHPFTRRNMAFYNTKSRRNQLFRRLFHMFFMPFSALFSRFYCTCGLSLRAMSYVLVTYVCTRFTGLFPSLAQLFQNVAIVERQRKPMCKQILIKVLILCGFVPVFYKVDKGIGRIYLQFLSQAVTGLLVTVY